MFIYNVYFSPTANLMNPVMVMQQPQEFDPYINARTPSQYGSQYGSRYFHISLIKTKILHSAK